MRTLAIDPGEKAGWALFQSQDLIKSGVCSGDIYKNLKEMRLLVKNLRPQKIVVESQFIRSGQKTAGIFTLVERQCVWKIIGLMEGIDVYNIDPAQWHSHWDLKVDMTIKKRTQRNKDFKQRMVLLVKEILGINVETDQADAILQGMCWTDYRSIGITL
jgi:hypothetical protein